MPPAELPPLICHLLGNPSVFRNPSVFHYSLHQGKDFRDLAYPMAAHPNKNLVSSLSAVLRYFCGPLTAPCLTRPLTPSPMVDLGVLYSAAARHTLKPPCTTASSALSIWEFVLTLYCWGRFACTVVSARPLKALWVLLNTLSFSAGQYNITKLQL